MTFVYLRFGTVDCRRDLYDKYQPALKDNAASQDALMKLPNFFIVGAPKAGTDELYYHLDQHPQIYMSPLKEPCFFSDEVRIENFSEELKPAANAAAQSLSTYLGDGAVQRRFGGIVTSIEDYHHLFTGVRDEVAIGEGSVSYLWSSSAASLIAKTIPHARIIIVLMDPAERAFHQYLKSFSDRNVTHSFHIHLELALRDRQDQINIYHPFLSFGNYTEQIRRFKKRFPSNQIHLSLYEDLQFDYLSWFRSVLTFLQVDNTFVPQPVIVPSTPHFSRFDQVGKSGRLESFGFLSKLIPRPLKSKLKYSRYLRKEKPSLSPEDREILVSYYRENIFKLEDLIGRDLSAWLRV